MENSKSDKQSFLWFRRLMAITATINFCLVLFDLSYVNLRDFYYRNLRQVTQVYDPVKGIETHRETGNYLSQVDEIEKQLNQTNISSPQVATKLEQLRRLSTEMIETNPFAAAGKSGTLEKIKNRMRARVGKESAKQAFNTFWSQEYLSKKGWKSEIYFFQNQIQPLITINYYRHIGENNELIDNFWLIDLPFVSLFGIEILFSAVFIKRRHPEFSWLDAILWEWYNLLLLPFWRFLRIIPVVIRLDKVGFINLTHIRRQINQGIVNSFAEELTEIVVVRVINQIQISIKQGDLAHWLRKRGTIRPYVDINNVNEVEAIATIFIKTIVYQVLPKVQPEITAILRHNIQTAFNHSPISRNLQLFPGMGQVQNQFSEQLATQIATNLYNAIVSAVEDPVSAELSSKLVQNFSESLGASLQKQHVLSELQNLIHDFLSEVKLNYVQRLSQEDIEEILQQTRQLRGNRERGIGNRGIGE